MILVVQGLMYYNITSSQKNLLQDANEGVFYIQQEIKSSKAEDNEDYEKELAAKSIILADELATANPNNYRVLIYDIDGDLLTDSANFAVSNDIDLREEVSLALDETLVNKGSSVSKYKRVDNISRIYNTTPIFIEDKRIGVVAFIYSLEYMDEIVRKVMMLFYTSSLISIIIIAVLGNTFTKSLLKPVNDLVESTKRISQGDFNELLDYSNNDEIGELTSNFNKMTLNIEEKINQVEEEKQKLASIIASIDDGVIAVNLNNKLMFFNQKSVELFELPFDFNPTSYSKAPFLIDIYNEVLEKGKEVIQEIDYSNKHLLVFGNMIKKEANIIGVLLVVRDITTLYELDKQQRQFVSSVSHELRTPLTTIIGYTDLLHRRGFENVDLTKKSLDTINKEGKRLLRLVDDLLSLSKYDNIEFKFIISKVDINQLLTDVISQMKIKSSKYNIDILYNRVDDLPIISGDYDRLKQVIINIIDNAIKYSNSDEVIKVMASYYNNYIEISIRDYGPGIAEDQLKYLFDPFYRADENRSRDSGGTGLGLSIVKRIVERHNGNIFIESKINEGTMIVIRLPMDM